MSTTWCTTCFTVFVTVFSGLFFHASAQGQLFQTRRSAPNYTRSNVPNTSPESSPSSYQVLRFRWYDSSRKRSVPVKVFCPVHTENRVPVILFSAGLGCTNEYYGYLGKDWARHGMVAVFIEHPGSNADVWQGSLRILGHLRDSYQNNWSARTRTQDVRFVLDQIQQLQEQGEAFGDMVDMERVGVTGHDLGALTALLMAGQIPPDGGTMLTDHRIKAILAMSPPVQRKSGFATIYGAVDVPACFITGTKDDGIIGTTTAGERRIPYDYMRGMDKYLVILNHADHQIYTGAFIRGQRRGDVEFQAAVTRISTLFWQSHLQNDSAAMARLQNPATATAILQLGRIEYGSSHQPLATK